MRRRRVVSLTHYFFVSVIINLLIFFFKNKNAGHFLKNSSPCFSKGTKRKRMRQLFIEELQYNMVRHIFLDKTNTITKGSLWNTGLNPILEINYGKELSRGLIHFDVNEIGDLIADGTFSDPSKLTCTLKMVNCASVDGLPYDKEIHHRASEPVERATSFDLILFKLPQDFDAGKGFDYASDFWVRRNHSRAYVNMASNWYYAQRARCWKVDEDKMIPDENGRLELDEGHPTYFYQYIYSGGIEQRIKVDIEGGIYSHEEIVSEYEKYLNGEESFIVGSQHFDFGAENLEIDVSKYVMESLESGENYGLCLAYVPHLERTRLDKQQYVSFFTDLTNTFFHPYVECKYCDAISDDRGNFCLGRKNRLYLYSGIDGKPVSLDSGITCTIDGKEYEVHQGGKGVYYVEITPDPCDFEVETIHYDIWSNLALNGEPITDIEQEFVVMPMYNFLSVGNRAATPDRTVPQVSGIDDAEELTRGETREVIVDFRKEYTTNRKELLEDAEWRLYVKDANRDFDVFDYQPVERAFLNNFFIINTEDLIPNDYYVDIRVMRGRETRYYKKVLRFRVVSNVTNRYE